MKDIEISINPLAEFLEAKDSRKKEIIEEQLNPNPVRIPYYAQARPCIIKSIFNNGDPIYINDVIPKINEKVADKAWKKSNKKLSIQALEWCRNIPLPDAMKNYPMEHIRTNVKFFPLYGVNIKVSPSGIFRIIIDGQKYIGAFQIHLSKGKIFSIKQSALVAQMLNLFLNNFVAEEDDIVDPQLCICIDPFSETVVTASAKMKYSIGEVKKACQEICIIWDNVTKAHVA